MQTDPFADFSHQISNRKSGIRIPRNLLKNKEPKQSLIAKKSRFLNPICLLSSLPRRSLTATADPTRIGILSYHRESKEVICGNMETLRAAEPVKFLNRNSRFTGFHSTCSKRATKRNSNRNKNGISAGSATLARHAFLPASPPCCLAATRLTRYNSGSHIEVNQP